MDIKDTLLYKYELSNKPLKYKSSINLFPRKLNNRLIKYNLTLDEFNSIIKACIEIEKFVLFLIYEKNIFLKFQNVDGNFKRFILKSDFILNFIKNKVYFLKKKSQKFKENEIPKIIKFKEILNKIDVNYLNYIDSVIKSYKSFFKQALINLKNYVIYIKLLENTLQNDYVSIKNQKSNLSKQILINYLQIRIKLIYLNKKMDLKVN